MKAKLLLIYYGYISKKLINGVFLKSHADAFIDPKPDEHAELSWQLFNTKSSFLSPSRSSIPHLEIKTFEGNQRRPIFSSLTKQPIFISVHPDGSDAWKLEPIADLIKQGGVGIIPTDTLPAVVCDMENNDAVRRLYLVKMMSPKKPLSLLCRGFTDIAKYTTGFPVSNEPGVPDTFSIVKKALPGPYTLILHASKKLPKQLIDYESHKTKTRKSVGVRWPKDVVCQTILDMVGRPLIASSMHVEHEENEDFERSNGVNLMEEYNDSGIDFIVSVGQRIAEESTIVDMTEREPIIVREGSGDSSPFKIVLSSKSQ